MCNLARLGIRRKTLAIYCLAGFVAYSGAVSAPMLNVEERVSVLSLMPECRNPLVQPRESKEACERLDRHIKWLEARLNTVCADAGERILRTAKDVDGIYIRPPSRDVEGSARLFHEEDRSYLSWMSPRRSRHFTLVEMDSFRKSGRFDQWHQEIVSQRGSRARVNETYTDVERPSAKYGLTWRALGERDDRAHGIHGDETTVFEVATGHVLAVRRFYYYWINRHTVDTESRILQSPHWKHPILEVIKPCANYRPAIDHGFIDRRPRDSHQFVARVLKAKTMSDEIALGIFDLTHGSGEKEGGCMTALFGPRIQPEDLELQRIDDHGLKITLKGTRDALYCEKFYDPGMHSKSALYRFYDGRVWTLAEIDKAASQNPRILIPLRRADPLPAEPPDLRFNQFAGVPRASYLVTDCRNVAGEPADSPRRADCERLDRHIERMEARLATACTDAGERIARTVSDVEGVFVRQPPPGTTDDTFHSEDRRWGAYMDPVRGRHYTLWESSGLTAVGKIEQHRYVMTPKGKERPLVNLPQQSLDRPTAKYGFTWASIGDAAARAQGMHGDETAVFEVATGETLAVRRVYYYVLGASVVDESGRPLQSPHWNQGALPHFVQTCRNYRLKENPIHTDFRPRDSYEFVAQVLKPKPVADTLAVGLFSLSRGTGAKTGGCTFVTFGPRVSPQDVEVSYVEHNSIRLAIKGRSDSLLCTGFYIPALRRVAHQAQFRFYDGSSWSFEDIDQRTNLRARVLASTLAPAKSDIRAAAPAMPAFPALEPGLWQLKAEANGQRTEQRYCGDPLNELRREISQVGTTGACTIQSAGPSQRIVNVVVECRDQVSRDGSRTVRGGRTHISLASPTPQSFTLQVNRGRDGYRETVQGVRLGKCEQRTQ